MSQTAAISSRSPSFASLARLVVRYVPRPPRPTTPTRRGFGEVCACEDTELATTAAVPPKNARRPVPSVLYEVIGQSLQLVCVRRFYRKSRAVSLVFFQLKDLEHSDARSVVQNSSTAGN